MQRARIYTEDLPKAREILAEMLEGATILQADGLWRGSWERSIVAEIVCFSANDERAVRSVADRIKKECHQETVLLTWEPVRAEMV